MKISEYVQIDQRFEKSINLALDLENTKKLSSYIPTHSSLKIIEKYLNNVNHYVGGRANILIGPYGKGKSHLLLVLLSILANIEGEDIDLLLNRIRISDEKIYGEILNYRLENKPMLRVVVSPGRENLAVSFEKALFTALDREKLTNIKPDTYFSEAVKTIEVWRNEYPETLTQFIEKSGYDIEETIKQLKLNKEEMLNVFMNTFPKVTSGAEFNPHVENDIVNVYKSVTKKLCNQFGYRGIYIVFDEFSKYVEGHILEGFASDMRILQEICALCDKSKEEQIHISLIAHKTISSYGSALPKEIINTFNAVSGRLEEIFFTVSSQNNYELISDSVVKKKGFDEILENSQSFKDILENSFTLNNFKSLFDKKDFVNIVAKGCYPLTPVATAVLLALSERVAQNERTLFTFIAGNDNNSLANFALNNEMNNYAGTDIIYDYFLPAFKEQADAYVHHEWIKSDYALSITTDSNAKKIIKSLAVIKMINKPDEIPAMAEYIRLALGMSRGDFEISIRILEETNVITYKKKTHTYEFKNNTGIDTDIIIKDIISKRYCKEQVLIDNLQSIMKTNFCMPKKHNQTYAMTRYFNFKFMKVEQFLAVKSSSFISWNNEPDGCIILILPEESIDKKEVYKHLTEVIKDKTMLVILPSDKSDYKEILSHFLAVKDLLTDSSFINDNPEMRVEFEYMLDDDEVEINEWINRQYMIPKEVLTYGKCIVPDINGLNRIVSDICDKEYSLTPIINHELINRHELSAPIKKARGIILECMINDKPLDYLLEGTSAESTIYRALLQSENSEGQRKIREVIHEFVCNCVDKKTKMSNLMNILQKPPYGMRKGVIPYYLTRELINMNDIPIIYFNDNEESISSDTICDMVDKADRYSLYIEKETKDKEDYITMLEQLFADYAGYCKNNDKRNRLARLSCLMQSWYRSLPQTSKTFVVCDYEGEEIKKIIALRKKLSEMYLNPREIVFDQIPRITNENNLMLVFESIKRLKEDVDKHIHVLKSRVIQKTRDILLLGEGNLSHLLKDWYNELSDTVKRSVLDGNDSKFLNYVKNIDENDEEKIIGKIAKIVTTIYIEDWNDKTEEVFEESLKKTIERIGKINDTQNARKQEFVFLSETGENSSIIYEYNPSEASNTATFFKNEIDSLLEEYDGSISNNEKIGILLDAVRKLTGGIG